MTKVAEHLDVCASFFDQLRRVRKRVLMLDYDGTLAPFTTDRKRAFPYREVPGLVSKIMNCHTRVILISGRPATELVFLSGIHPHPEIWGSHGAERLLPDGSYRLEGPEPRQRTGLQVAQRSLREAGLAQRMESKPTGVAVHWRGLPSEERARIERKVQAAAPIVDEYGLKLLPFDGGLEIQGATKNKGDAVTAILREAGKGAAAAYLGDDQTDENAFRAIKGHGLAVLVRRDPRPTMADAWLRPPDELGNFLREWLVACGAER